MPRTIWHAAAAAAMLCLCAGPAQAHAPATTAGDFYAGLLHPLSALEHMLAFIAFGLLGGQQGTRAHACILIFPAALVAGAAFALFLPSLPVVELLDLASAVLLGLLVAAAVRLPTSLLHAIAVLLGLVHGYANGAALIPPLKPLLYLPGIAFAGFLVTAWGFVVVDFTQRRQAVWMPIAIRVVGSWIAAIGILVVGFSARQLMN